MDDIDKRILRLLQADNLRGVDKIGEKVGLSASAAHRRIKRLREDGVIAADVSVIEPQALGRAMTFVVEVTLERENASFFESFKKRMREAPEVQQCYYVTGEGDFILIITAAEMDDYEKITSRLFLGDTNVKHYRTSVVMNRIKVSLAIPVV